MSATIDSNTTSSVRNTLSPQHVVPHTAPRYITQLTHPEGKPVGKQIWIDPATQGLVTKADIAVGVWAARTLRVDTLEDMKLLLEGQRMDQALILDYCEAGGMDGYWLVSEKAMQAGWQSPDGNPVVQLKKDNFKESGWVCMDWDYDPTRPDNVRDSDVEAWWRRMCGKVPALIGIGRVSVPSSKGRVFLPDGTPAFKDPSYHTYIRTENRHLLENAGKLIEARMWLGGDGYVVAGKGGIGLKRSPFDPCTFSISRRVFESAPSLGEGLVLAGRGVKVFSGPPLDLATITPLDAIEIEQYKQMTSRELGYRGEDSKLRVSCMARDLSLNMIVDTEEGSMTVRQYRDGGYGKLRCQTPFRESTSQAGVLNRHESGEVFLYDVGTQTKHLLDATAAFEGLVFGGNTQNVKLPMDVRIGVKSHVDMAKEALSNLDPQDTDATKVFIALCVEHLDESQQDLIKVALKAHTKGFRAAKGIEDDWKRVVKDNKSAGKSYAINKEREAVELEVALLREQSASGGFCSDPDGVIVNPVHAMSADAVGYALTMVDDEGRIEKVLPHLENMKVLFRQYGISIRRNQMTHGLEFDMPGYTFANDNRINHALEMLRNLCVAHSMPTERLIGMVEAIADESQFHPMKDYLATQEPWDGLNWIGMLSSYIRVEESREAARDLFFRKWMISAMALIYDHKGIQPKGVLTLAGPQHIGKTQFLRNLVPDPAWFLEGHLLQPGDRDSEKLYASHFLTELGEVDSTFRKSDIAALKAFLSKGRDDIRLPYDKAHVTWRRRTLPCASVNKLDFLVDETGNSRFWPVEALSFDFQALNEFYRVGGVDRAWKQAQARYEAGEQWWLEGEDLKTLAIESESHRSISGLEQAMLDLWDWDRPGDTWRHLTATQIGVELGLNSKSGGRYGLAPILRRLLEDYTGQEKASARKGCTGKVWKVPPMIIDDSAIRGL